MIFIKKTVFDNELYDYIEHEDGSKTLHTSKNKSGFKITLNISGDKRELQEGIKAVKDFFVKGNL